MLFLAHQMGVKNSDSKVKQKSNCICRGNRSCHVCHAHSFFIFPRFGMISENLNKWKIQALWRSQ